MNSSDLKAAILTIAGTSSITVAGVALIFFWRDRVKNRKRIQQIAGLSAEEAKQVETTLTSMEAQP